MYIPDLTSIYNDFYNSSSIHSRNGGAKDDDYPKCEAANRSVPYNQALENAQKTPRNISKSARLDVSRATEEIDRLLACQPGTPNLAIDHFVHELLQLKTGSIRLVEVLAPHSDGIIRCSIKHTEIDRPSAPTEFTCLSYTWGSPSATRWILMNGKPMEVGYNLWEFLRAVSEIRAHHGDRKSPLQLCSGLSRGDHEYRSSEWYCNLWIDALCINQKHYQERNHQVQQMGLIYQSATEVIVWLGNDAKVAALFDWNKRKYWDRMHKVLYEDLGKNPYWNRAWVVQEIFLAKHVCFLSNGVMVSLNPFKRKIENLLTYPMRPEFPELLNLATQYSSNAECTHSHSLIHNVGLFRHRECKDLRDRVYSALSMSSNGKELAVKYDRSLLELAQDVLYLNKDGVCLNSVFTLIKVLELDSRASDQEKGMLFVELHHWQAMEHIAPCTQCGEPRGISQSMRGENIRYICLQCKHPQASKDSGVHSTCQNNGHLYLVEEESLKIGRFEWNLFWSPFGVSGWIKIEGVTFISPMSGSLRVLKLSLGVLCELLRFTSRPPHKSIQRDSTVYREKARPFDQAKWKAVSSSGE
jgi:hypothetical protein